jgi:hypothetical protein
MGKGGRGGRGREGVTGEGKEGETNVKRERMNEGLGYLAPDTKKKVSA